jgi:hypothetical protein
MEHTVGSDVFQSWHALTLRASPHRSLRRSSKGRMAMKGLTEQEIRSCYIMPTIRQSRRQPHQIREEVYIMDGQIHPEFRVKV